MKPMDAQWSGSSVNGVCRIADISLGGCYVQTLASPSKGEPTSITIVIDGQPFTLHGHIAYVDQTIGFAMKFDGLGPREREALQRLEDSFSAERERDKQPDPR